MSDPVAGSLLGRVGRWGVSFVPATWEFVFGVGIQKLQTGGQAANICLSEDTLPAGKLLYPYLVAQQTLFHRAFANPKIAGPSVIPFQGAEEAALLFLKHGQLESAATILQAQTYVRCERWIGIVTFTTTAERFSGLRANYQSFVAGLRICQPYV